MRPKVKITYLEASGKLSKTQSSVTVCLLCVCSLTVSHFMESPKPFGRSNPLLSLSSFIHQHCLRLRAELSNRLEDTKRLAGNFLPPATRRLLSASGTPPLAWVGQPSHALAATATLSSDHVAKSLVGTAVYTVSNSNNEFVLISDPNAAKSIGLLCFRKEDAEAFLAQVSSFFLFAE